MQNKCNCGCNCGCNCQGFVPVNGNWDFNSNCDSCQQGYTRRNRRYNSCGCDEREQTYAREREYDCQSGSDRQSGSDCQCERCDDDRQVECCDKNTYVREMEDCKCDSAYNRNRSGNCGCDKDDSAYNRNRSGSCGCDKDDSAYNRNRSGNCGCDKDDSAYNRNRSGSCGCDKDDSAYNRNRSNDCGCDKDDSAYNRNRSGNCGCDKDNGTTYARSDKNRHVGMVNVQRQKIDEIFESESGLRAGTLFPELHKPLNGYCPCDGNCSTCAQESAFAAWELRLYLNTHPGDKEALALFRKLRREAEEINYATTFLEDDCSSGWNWVKNPWPWEYDCQCGD